MVLAMVGLLQPFLVLCWATYATVTFPSRIASGRGLRLVHRYRFLFHRFKPDCPWTWLGSCCGRPNIALSCSTLGGSYFWSYWGWFILGFILGFDP